MPRRKKQKYREAYELPNVFSEIDEGLESRIRSYFNNQNPITLEIGCGWGEYSLNLAQEYPERNFIGIDLKAVRIWKGANYALDNGIDNVAYIITQANYIEQIFQKEKIEEIWIPFPDPYPKLRKEKKRLVYPKYLEMYKNILMEGGKVHLKTDNTGFYEYALETLDAQDVKIYESTSDLYNGKIPNRTEINVLTEHSDIDRSDFEKNIVTKYEKHHLDEGKKIKYVCFGFD
jgi:tRNA (guanine-N7-)-methyltransferase